MSDVIGYRVRVTKDGDRHRWEVFYDDMHTGRHVVASGEEDSEREAWLTGLIAKEQA